VSDGRFLDPGIDDGERTTYRGAVDDDGPAGEGTLVIRAPADEPARYVMEAEMEIGGELSYELRFEVLRRRGALLADHYRLDTSHGDRPVAAEEGWFRDVAALGWGGAIERYPSDVAPLLGCALMLRGLEFEKGAKRSFSLWLANTVYWEIEAKVEKRERVSVAAGDFDAWRVRVRPSFESVASALDRIIALLLPPFVLHFAAEPPHRFLRFAFPTGPFPWNPRATIEAVTVEET
jgi:hypothetical protein